MDIITSTIVFLIVFDGLLFVLNTVLRRLRKKDSRALFTAKKDTNELSRKVDQMTGDLARFRSENVSLSVYNELMHKYDLLLDQNRRMSARNKFLESRVSRLKEKVY